MTEVLPDGTFEYAQCEMYTGPGKNATTSCSDGWTYDPGYFDEDDGTIVMEV